MFNRSLALNHWSGRRASCFFNKLCFEAHCSEAVDLAVDVMIGIDQADILDFRAHLDNPTATLELQVLDDDDRVTVLKNVPSRVAIDFRGGL